MGPLPGRQAGSGVLKSYRARDAQVVPGHAALPQGAAYTPVWMVNPDVERRCPNLW